MHTYMHKYDLQSVLHEKKEKRRSNRKKNGRVEKKRKKNAEEMVKKHHNYRDSQNGLVKDQLLQGPLND